MVWDSAPPSDQLAKAYWVPVAVWGDEVAIVCVLPAGSDNTWEALYETPSTVYVAPLGLVPTVTATPVPKLADTTCGADMVTVVAAELALATLPVQLVN